MTTPGIKQESAVNAAEEAQADAMASTARLRFAAPISAATIAAAAQAERQGDPADHQIGALLAQDVAMAVSGIIESLHAALEAGYSAELTMRTQTLDGGKYTADVTEADLAAVHQWPILGHQSGQVARHLGAGLQFGAWPVLVGIMGVISDGSEIGPQIDAVSAAFADSVAGWVRQAYWSGVQAAQIEISAAVSA